MNDLLKIVAENVESNWDLCGSKWQNCECEVIVAQTIHACVTNLEKCGEAFSWLNENATRGRANCGTNNGAALNRLIADRSITIGDYVGTAVCPEGTVYVNGKPQVVRVTEQLLKYVAKHIKLEIDV